MQRNERRLWAPRIFPPTPTAQFQRVLVGPRKSNTIYLILWRPHLIPPNINKVDIGRAGLQRTRNLLRYEDVRIFHDETLQLARSLEHPDISRQTKTNRWPIQSVQLDPIRLAALFQFEALALHARPHDVLFHCRTRHVLSQIYLMGATSSFSMSGASHLYVACWRCCDEGELRIYGQPVTTTRVSTSLYH